MRLGEPALAVGIGAMVLAAAYCAAALALPVSLLSDEVGAAGIPVALAAVLGAAGALLTLLTLLRPEGRAWSVSPRSAGLLAILAAYVIALPVLGYPLAIGLLIAVVAVYAGAPPTARVAVVAVAGGAAFWLVFVRALGIAMPAGWLHRLV